MKPLFPYFGGKRRAAGQVWQALGRVSRYVEPFFGSGAVLLGNPNPPLSELVNDLDHHVANLWRSLQSGPDEVWRVASAPPSEVELRARHAWLEQWEAPDFADLSACDPYAAGVWLYRACAAIRHNADLHRSSHGMGTMAPLFTRADFDAVAERVRRIQVMCGDWSRCVTPAALTLSTFGASANVGVFLDPPYGTGSGVAYDDGTGDTARDVWRWAVEHGDDPRIRIVVAGYDDGRDLPDGWSAVERAEKGGYGNANGNANRTRERLWLSPHCLHAKQETLF
jgi:DNA adenine methylase